MGPLTLEYRRAFVAAFWIVGASLLFVLVAAAAAAYGMAHSWAWAAGVCGAAVLPGAFWRPWFAAGVRAWNGVAWRLAGALRAYVLTVGYFVVFTALAPSRAARDLPDDPFERTGWIVRGRHFGGLQMTHLRAGERAGTVRTMAAFARAPGKRWSLCLVPMIFLLNLLQDEQQEAAVPGSTYTLY